MGPLSLFLLVVQMRRVSPLCFMQPWTQSLTCRVRLGIAYKAIRSLRDALCEHAHILLSCSSASRSSSTLAARMSRTQHGPQYLVSVAVLLTELMKLTACIVVRTSCRTKHAPPSAAPEAFDTRPCPCNDGSSLRRSSFFSALSGPAPRTCCRSPLPEKAFPAAATGSNISRTAESHSGSQSQSACRRSWCVAGLETFDRRVPAAQSFSAATKPLRGSPAWADPLFPCIASLLAYFKCDTARGWQIWPLRADLDALACPRLCALVSRHQFTAQSQLNLFAASWLDAVSFQARYLVLRLAWRSRHLALCFSLLQRHHSAFCARCVTFCFPQPLPRSVAALSAERSANLARPLNISPPPVGDQPAENSPDSRVQQPLSRAAAHGPPVGRAAPACARSGRRERIERVRCDQRHENRLFLRRVSVALPGFRASGLRRVLLQRGMPVCEASARAQQVACNGGLFLSLRRCALRREPREVRLGLVGGAHCGRGSRRPLWLRGENTTTIRVPRTVCLSSRRAPLLAVVCVHSAQAAAHPLTDMRTSTQGVYVERMLKVGEAARIADNSELSPLAGAPQSNLSPPLSQRVCRHNQFRRFSRPPEPPGDGPVPFHENFRARGRAVSSPANAGSVRDLGAAAAASQRMPLMTLNTLLAAWGTILAGLQARTRETRSRRKGNKHVLTLRTPPRPNASRAHATSLTS